MFNTQFDELDLSAPDTGPATALPESNTPPVPLHPGDAVTQWLHAAPQIEVLRGPWRPQPDNVDYAFGAKGPNTGFSPAREAMQSRLERASAQAPVPQVVFDRLHVTSGSPRIDFSLFAFVPLLITRALVCRIHADEAGVARFRLATCGVVRIWIDGTPAAYFAPFTQNREQTQEIELHLPAGPCTLTLELQDVHERNTVNFFALLYLSGVAVSASVPAAAPEALADAAAVLGGLDFDRVFYEESTPQMGLAVPPKLPLTLHVAKLGQVPRNHCWDDVDLPRDEIALTPGATSAALPELPRLPTGATELWLTAKVSGILCVKRIGTTVLTRGTELTGDTVSARKAEVLALAATDTGRDIAVPLAQLSQGICTDETVAHIRLTLRIIGERHDCSDFALLQLLRIWKTYREFLPEGLADEIRAVILGYRYWVSEPGADAMWFWSENHVLCYHIAQFIAGDLFPAEEFPNSGHLGQTHREEGRQRIYRWFTSIDQSGLGEWNSAAYYPIDLLALLTLHDLSPDPVLREKAARLMDKIFIMAGLHASGGASAGSQGRSYEKDLLTGAADELGTTLAVAFGGLYYPALGRSTVNFCLSDYEPPATAAGLARPAKGDVLEASYWQGDGQLGKLALWKTADSQLSAVCDHGTGQRGGQQHVVDAQFSGHQMARLWINHPGDYATWSERRPSRLAGNYHLPRVAQWGPSAFLIYDLPDAPDCIPFTQLFAVADAFDEVIRSEFAVALRSGDGWARIWCSEPLQTERGGPYAGSIFRANALRAGWVITLGDDGTDGTAKGIAASLETQRVTLSQPDLVMRFGACELDYHTGRLREGERRLERVFAGHVPRVSVNGGAPKDFFEKPSAPA